jgi:phytoene dehydrogenase-like protein
VTERFDVAVIGAGHNGLVCAFYLARAGFRVVVLERCDQVGGAAVTEEFHPGFRNSIASYTVSLLAPRVIDDMALYRRGLRVVPRPIANFLPQIEGSGLALHGDVKSTQAAIRDHSVADADRYADFVAELARVTPLLREMMLQAPLNFFAEWREGLRSLKCLPRLAAKARAAGPSVLWGLLTGSAGDWLDRWFETGLLKGGLGFDSIVGHFASPYTPGSGYLLLHHALGEVDGVRGAWGHAIGGMGAITAAMAKAAIGHGAEIRCGDGVAAVEPQVDGIELLTAAGNRYAARAVAGAIHPQVLFGRLLRGELLPQPFRERIDAWRSESASFRINVALSELPDFSCFPGKVAAPHHASGILIAPSLEYLEQAYLDARAHGWARRPVIEMLIPSTVDESLAPGGAHVASIFCQHFARRLPEDGSWATEKSRAVDAILGTIDSYAPNFRSSIIGIQALSPEDLERRFGLIGGDIFHGQMTLDQLYWARPAVGYANYRSPLRGVYLCGAGAHPGGGVSGAPGHNAARVILGDLERRRV